MMNKIFHYISAAVLVLGLAACTKEGIQESPIEKEAGRQVVFWAGIDDETSTKTSLSGNDAEGYKVLWSEGDKIIAQDGWSSKFTLVEGAGTTRGKFAGTAMEGDGTYDVFYGTDDFYLYNKSQYNGDKGISSAPMMATITISNGEVTTTDFKNICGLLHLNIKGSGTVSQIKIYADQSLYGKFDISSDGSAEIISSAYQDYITHECKNGVLLSNAGTDFYISMAPNDYTGVKIEVSDFNGNICTKTLKADKTLNIARAQITPVSFTVTGLTNDNVPITWDSPVGARGTLYGRECVVIELAGNKIAMATKNEGAKTPESTGTSMTWFNAVKSQNSGSWGEGWRLPTKDEWDSLHIATQYYPIKYEVAENCTLIFPKANYWSGFVDLYADPYDYYAWHYGSLGPADGPNESCQIRLVHYLPITSNTPEGKIGYIDGKEGMVIKRRNGSKVIVATRNEGATSNDTYYKSADGKTTYYDCIGTPLSYSDAQSRCSGNWHIPSTKDFEDVSFFYNNEGNIGDFCHRELWKEELPTLNQNISSGKIYSCFFHYFLDLYLPATGNPDGTSFQYYEYPVDSNAIYWTSTDSDGGKKCLFMGIRMDEYRYIWRVETAPATTKVHTRLFHEMPE